MKPNKYLALTVLAFALSQAYAAPKIIATNTTTDYVKSQQAMPNVVLQETPLTVFTERQGTKEATYQESEQLLKLVTRNVTTKVVTTTTYYADKTTVVTKISEVVQDYDTFKETAQSTRNLVGTRDLTLTEITQQNAITQQKEYATSTGLTQIKAYAAWQQGFTGQGVVVAVVDSGYSDKQTTDRVKLLTGKNFVTNSTNTNDDNGHGTHVAGIIAAPLNGVGVAGVAYNATILPVKVLDAATNAPMSRVAEGVLYAAQQGAKVINLSISKNYTYDTQKPTQQFDADFGQAYLTAVQSGSTVVAAAGNLGSSCTSLVTGYNTTKMNAVNGYTTTCGFPAALPLVTGYESLTTSKGGWIAVGALDANNNIASYSNKAGATKQWFLVAPGSNIESTGMNNNTVKMSGTSMAAPYVSASVALLTEKYPKLTGAQVAEILFKTATDLGAPGIDDVYGWGMINLERAMQPVGQLKLKNSQQSLDSVKPIVVPQALASSVAKAASVSNIQAVDSYNREYQVNVLQTVTTKSFGFQNYPVYQANNFLAYSSPEVTVLGYQTTPNTQVLVATDQAGQYMRVSYQEPIGKFSLGSSVDTGTLSPIRQQQVNVSRTALLGATAWIGYRGFELGTVMPMVPVLGTIQVNETQETFKVNSQQQQKHYWLKHNYSYSKQANITTQVLRLPTTTQVNLNAFVYF